MSKMQLTETVTIINKSGEVISNGKHIVNLFGDAKAAYRQKKAALKAERAAAAAGPRPRPSFTKAHTFAGRASRGLDPYHAADEYEYDYGVPEQQHQQEYQQYLQHFAQGYQTAYPPSHYYIEGEPDDRRRSFDENDERRSEASSRRSHAPGSLRSRRTTRTTSAAPHPPAPLSESNLRTLTDVSATAPSRVPHPPAPLSESNLRTLTDVSATAPSRVPRSAAPPSAASRLPLSEHHLRTRTDVSATAPSQAPRSATASVYRAPYAETMALSRPTLVHANTAPVPLRDRALSELSLGRGGSASSSRASSKEKKKKIDMDLAYGNVPPDLATRTDLGPVTAAEEAAAAAAREADARRLMGRIDALLDEAQCAQHGAAAAIAHLQQQPEAAAAVALLLAELSALLKTLSPAFLGVVKGGSPAVFALLASPQFLVAVGVAVGVTVISFGGWKIVKRIRKAKAAAAERAAGAMAFEMHEPAYSLPHDARSAAAHQAGGGGGGASQAGSYDDALVFEEELSTIETWRRGITPPCEDTESVDLELITPAAVKSVAPSIRTTTTRTHRSHEPHRSHRGGHRSDERAAADGGGDAASDAASSSSVRSARSKTTVRTRTTLAIEDGARDADNTVAAMLARPTKERKATMLKALFKKKKDKEEGREAVTVLV